MANCRGLAVLLLTVLVALPACTTRASSSGAPVAGPCATIIPDSARLRSWDNPLGGNNCVSGSVVAQVGCTTLGGTRDRFQVPAGRVDMQLIYRDTRDTVPDKRLETKPIAFSFNAQANRTYRIRGMAFYPQGQPRPYYPSEYRVVFAAEDTSTGQIVQKIDVPPANNVWRNTSPDLLMEVLPLN